MKPLNRLKSNFWRSLTKFYRKIYFGYASTKWFVNIKPQSANIFALIRASYVLFWANSNLGYGISSPVIGKSIVARQVQLSRLGVSCRVCNCQKSTWRSTNSRLHCSFAKSHSLAQRSRWRMSWWARRTRRSKYFQWDWMWRHLKVLGNLFPHQSSPNIDILNT